MTDHLESVLVTEANRLSIRLNAEALRQAAIDLAGSQLTSEGLIAIPGRGSISTADYIRSLRDQRPEGFGSIDSESPTAKADGNLTERYAAEITASRNKPRLDASKFTGITRRYIEENQGKHR